MRRSRDSRVDAVVGISLLPGGCVSCVLRRRLDDCPPAGVATSRGFSSATTTDWAPTSPTTTGSTGSSTGSRRASTPSSPSVYPHCSAWQLYGRFPAGLSSGSCQKGNEHSPPRPEWVLAGAFLTGAMAWGMTLRPEPIIAVLVTGTLMCAVWLSEGGGPRPLAVLALLVPLAVTGHHAGVVALASLVVIAGPVLTWARTEIAAAVAIVTSAFALLVTLAFVGSDIAQRADDARATRVYGRGIDTWRDEATRYDYLSLAIYASPLETRVGCTHGTRRSRVRPAAPTRTNIPRRGASITWRRADPAHRDPQQVALAFRGAGGHRRRCSSH